MKTYNIISTTILITLLVVGAFFFAYNKFQQNNMKYYNKGSSDTIRIINEKGIIPIISNNNETLTLNWVNINEVCYNLK
jgi:hypothetical protein